MRAIGFFAATVLSAAVKAGTLTVGCPTADIGEFRELAAFAKTLGATHLDACQIEHSLWQWNVNRHDPYPNWSMHRPSVFKFIVPEPLKQYLPADYAQRNLNALKARAAVLREYGFKADFRGMEPAYLPEQAYLDHPAWRGARCDQTRRSRAEYYAPCVENPEVRKMYVDAVAELCRTCPFDRFKFRCNDSGSALCWCEALYPGRNGPAACADVPMGKRVADALSIFQEGAARAGLPGARVNIRANVGPEEAIFPWLKPGMSVNNRTSDGEAATYVIGFPNRFTDTTAPLLALSRMPYIARQIQAAQAHPDADVEIGLRSLNEHDSRLLLGEYLRKPIGAGPAARWTALQRIAAKIVGEGRAVELVEAWESLDGAVDLLERYQTGGHLFLLGTLHQRWLTRPLVPFPGELKGEDRAYWRDFIFQAQEESDANNLLDLQAHRWLSGYGGFFLLRAQINGARPRAVRAAELLKSLQSSAVDAEAARYLADQLAKTRMYVCILDNALHAVNFQFILDRTDFDEEPRDTSPVIREQGDVRLYELNLIVRAEIDNTHLMISILEGARDPLFEHAATDKEQTIMRLGPKSSLIRDLRRKVAVMEAHRRDFLRLYKSYNR